MMLFFRVLQGMGGGGLAPTEQSIFADSFTPKQRAIAFSVYGFTVVTAPAIGPVLGGWLTDAFSWHWVFLINLPFGALSLTLTWLFVYDSDEVKQDRQAAARPRHQDRLRRLPAGRPRFRVACKSCWTASNAMTASPHRSS